MLKKIIAAVAAIGLTAALVALVAGPASAHNYTVDATCTTGVTVNLTDYAAQTGGSTNTITVVVDGVTDENKTPFGATFTKNYPWPVLADSHSVHIVVTAWDDPTGAKNYSFDQTKAATDCAQPSSAGDVKHTDPYCSAAGVIGNGGYTIPSVAAATFTVTKTTTSGVKTTDVETADTYSAAPGTVVHVVATPSSNLYVLTGTTVWDFTIGALDASSCVVPDAPTFTASACTVQTPGIPTSGSYTIPASKNGITYAIKGTTAALAAGPHTVTTFPTSVDIVAIIPSGDVLPANTTTEWTYTFTSGGACLVDSKFTAPSASPETCLVSNPGQPVPSSYTLTKATGVEYQVTITNGTTVTGPITQTDGTFFLNPGDKVHVVAVPLFGYQLDASDGKTVWDFSYTTVTGGCVEQTTSAYPTFTDEVCDTAHPGTSFTGSYTLTSTADQHVHFLVSINGATALAQVPGTYDTNPGDKVTVQIVPDSGYAFSAPLDATKLNHTYPVALNCLVDSNAVKPATTAESCVPDGEGGGGLGQLSGARTADTIVKGLITIPSTTGVQYFIDNVAVSAGDVTEEPGDYQVTAAALTGYSLVLQSDAHPDGYPVGGWTVTVGSDQLCTHPLVQPTATPDPSTCTAAGSYTLGNDLNDAAAITWTVNGSTVSPGTYTASAGSTVVVHAVANGPSYGLEPDAQTDWTFSFTAPAGCDLKTLALTGSSPTGWLTLGYLMLVSGLALLAVRIVRRRSEQRG